MSSKIKNVVLFCLFSLCLAGKANAGLIVGDLYEDAAGIQWEYVGSFDLTDDSKQVGTPKSLNGIEAALLHFSGLSASEITLSSNKESAYANIVDFIVNHQAFYDTYDSTGQLGLSGAVSALANLSTTDQNGDSLYNSLGDMSANVHDRQSNRAEIAFLESVNFPVIPELYINHVFKSVSVSVPEPSTLAIFAIALVGLASRRFKK